MGIVTEGTAAKHYCFMNRCVLKKRRFMTALLKTEEECFPLICRVSIYRVACLAFFFTKGLML
jgi:hypothetical protein